MMLSRNTMGIEFVRHSATQFIMGSNDPAAVWDQSPAHRVTISQDVVISEQPITIEQYRAFRPVAVVNEQFAPFVSGISWHDAVAFCEWLSEQDNVPYRLPTEAEWECVFPLPLREGGRGRGKESAAARMVSRLVRPLSASGPSRSGWHRQWHRPRRARRRNRSSVEPL